MSKRNGKIKKLFLCVLGFVAAYILVGALLDRVIFPESEAGAEYYPPEGYVFVSKSEGFRQTILKRENGLFWLELVLEPHAAGPPEHIHTTFSENFMVAEGTLTLLVNGEKKLLRPGETFLVSPNTPHKPFNETDAPVVVKGPLTPEFGIPEPFSVFLTQAYGFFDESESNNSLPKAILQMSRFAPKYDSWLAAPPVFLQKALFFVIGPTARLLGYRTFYEKYKPSN
ncbi:MAG TPA: cupin domain-containing protein [Pyrinomonadaceae bacterium]|jgi:quercetin dioxygenase-like cupin family protein